MPSEGSMARIFPTQSCHCGCASRDRVNKPVPAAILYLSDLELILTLYREPYSMMLNDPVSGSFERIKSSAGLGYVGRAL